MDLKEFLSFIFEDMSSLNKTAHDFTHIQYLFALEDADDWYIKMYDALNRNNSHHVPVATALEQYEAEIDELETLYLSYDENACPLCGCLLRNNNF